MENLNHSLSSDTPRLLHVLANKGYNLSTLSVLGSILSGLDAPKDIGDTREFVSDLLEMQQVIEHTINMVEDKVSDAIHDGKEVTGYKVTQASRRYLTDPDKALCALVNRGYSEEDITEPEKLIGIPALEKLLKADNIECKEFTDLIDKKLFDKKLKRI